MVPALYNGSESDEASKRIVALTQESKEEERSKRLEKQKKKGFEEESAEDALGARDAGEPRLPRRGHHARHRLGAGEREGGGE